MIEFITYKYVWAWGHNPRGYGWWVFEDRRTGEHIEVRGMYSEAKKQVRKILRTRGVRNAELVVLP